MRDRRLGSSPSLEDLEGTQGGPGSFSQPGLLGEGGGSGPWCIRATKCHQQGRTADGNRKVSLPCPGGHKSEMMVWQGCAPSKAAGEVPTCLFPLLAWPIVLGVPGV